MIGPDPTPDGRLVVGNEFASVVLEQDPAARGALVRVLDLRTGRAIVLDPLELEALTRLTRDDLTALVNPSFAGLAGVQRARDGLELVPGEGEESLEGRADLDHPGGPGPP